MPPSDYIDYISNLDDYRDAAWEQLESDKPWPVAMLGGKIRINLIHYKTSQAGEEAWRRRTDRINKNRMCFVLVETDGCTHDDLLRFDALPYRHKVALTHKPYPDIKCAFVIKGYERIGAVTDSYRFHRFWPTRKYDQFNWMKFLKEV